MDTVKLQQVIPIMSVCLPLITVFLNLKGAVCEDLRKVLTQFKKRSECISSYEPLKILLTFRICVFELTSL